MSVTGARLFVALWPEASLQRALFDRARPWVAEAGGKAVAEPHLHLTLAFLGAVEPELQQPVEAALGAIRGAPFVLTLDRIGSFGGGIVWAGPGSVPAPLSSLQAEVALRLRALGIALDARPYAAHVTLARKARKRVRDGLPPLSWPVERFRLVASVLGRAAASYQCVREWTLTGA